MAISAWGSKDEGCEYYESAKSESYRHRSSWLKIEFDRLDPIDPKKKKKNTANQLSQPSPSTFDL